MEPSDEDRTIGQRARTIRRRRGLSVEVAAGLAGISTGYLSLLERGHRRFERRGLLDDLSVALGCSVADLTGQPYLPTDRATADALATLPGIAIAVHDATLDDPPDVVARPVEQLAAVASRANAHLDAAQFSLAGHDLDTALAELHVAAASVALTVAVRRWAGRCVHRCDFDRPSPRASRTCGADRAARLRGCHPRRRPGADRAAGHPNMASSPAGVGEIPFPL